METDGIRGNSQGKSEGRGANLADPSISLSNWRSQSMVQVTQSAMGAFNRSERWSISPNDISLATKVTMHQILVDKDTHEKHKIALNKLHNPGTHMKCKPGTSRW